METIAVNIAGGRREVLNGREYWVAQFTSIVPGVLNGSKGALYYPAEEIERSVDHWNGIPILLNHPTDVDGNPVSGRSPTVWNSALLGHIFNSTLGTAKELRGEAWFDIQITKKHSPYVMSSLESGKPIELSTGLFTKDDPAHNGAEYNGTPYTHIARNYRPDHLAILPDSRGACSVTDGCGVNNASGSKLTHADLYSQLSMLLQDRFRPPQGAEAQGLPTYADCYVVDVYDRKVIYTHDDRMWSIDYTTDQRSGKVSLSDARPTEVRRVTTYKPVTNQGDDGMPLTPEQRKAIVDDLTTNCDCWKHNGDREVLNGFNDDKLTSLKSGFDKSRGAEALVQSVVQSFSHGDTKFTFNQQTRKWEPEVTSTTASAPTVNSVTPPAPPVAKIPTAQDWLNSAPPEIRSVVQNALAREQMEKQELTGRLTANMGDGAMKQTMTTWLLSKPVEELRNMVSLLSQPQQATYAAPLFNWGGAAGGPPASAVLTANEQADVLDFETARAGYDPLILNARK